MKISELINQAGQRIVEHLGQQKVYHNPKIAIVKNLAKHNEDGQVRFVIYKNNDVVVGDASYFTHLDLAPDFKNWDAKGFVQWVVSEEYSYVCVDPLTNLPKKNMWCNLLERFGIVDGYDENHYSIFEDDLVAENFTQQKILVNPTVNALKTLLQSSDDGQVRFVIYKHNEILAADATYYTHTDLAPDTENWLGAGMLYFLPRDEFFYTYSKANKDDSKDPEFLKRLEKRGFENKNGTLDGLFGQHLNWD